MTSPQPYQAPVDRLLQELNFIHSSAAWPDYPTLYGLTTADLPELIRLGVDLDPPSDEDDIGNMEWMIHALRAVTQLDPTQAIDLYLQQLQIFEDDEFLWEEARTICPMVGSAAIAPLTAFLNNTAENEWSRVSVINGLTAIAIADPPYRDACVQTLLEQLRLYQEESSAVIKSALVDNLVQLKAVEAADLIAEVFATGELDEFQTGSWPKVQVKLGLKSESDFSPEELKATPPPQILALRKALGRSQESGDRQSTFNLKLPPKKKASRNPLVFPNPTPNKPKSAGFGASEYRSKKNKPKEP
jgi:Protein of unknown function (DUF1186)